MKVLEGPAEICGFEFYVLETFYATRPHGANSLFSTRPSLHAANTLHTETLHKPISRTLICIPDPHAQKSSPSARARRLTPRPQPLASAVGFLSPWPREGDDQGRSHRHRSAVGSDGGDGARPLRDDRLAHLVRARVRVRVRSRVRVRVRVRVKVRVTGRLAHRQYD